MRHHDDALLATTASNDASASQHDYDTQPVTMPAPDNDANSNNAPLGSAAPAHETPLDIDLIRPEKKAHGAR